MVKSIKALFLPVGRASRPEMAVAAVVMLAAEALFATMGAQLGSLAANILKALVLWVGVVVIIRRLHDLGYSAWWCLVGAGFLCMWGSLMLLSGLFLLGREVVMPGSTMHLVVLSLTMLPAVGAALWLHLAPGDPHRNRYGLPTQPAPPVSAAHGKNASSQDMGLAR